MFFYVYLDQQREWRWRLYAANNRIIANGGEGYHNKQDCIDAINLVASKTSGIPIHYES